MPTRKASELPRHCADARRADNFRQRQELERMMPIVNATSDAPRSQFLQCPAGLKITRALTSLAGERYASGNVARW